MSVENVSAFFEGISTKMENDPENSKSVNAVYCFDISGDGGGTWTLDFKAPEVRDGSDDSVECTVKMSDNDFLGIINGSMNPMQAFMTGKIQVSGNMALAMKLQTIMNA